MRFHSLFLKVLIWRRRHVSDKNFVLLLSGVIGIVAGLAAVLLKTVVGFIHHIIEHARQEASNVDLLYFLFPLVGIILTVVVTNHFIKDKLGHGITGILLSISKESAIIKASRMYSRMITSAITVGLGGSVGLEAPIVVTGSAIGSNIARAMQLNYQRRSLLIGAGAAGAISAIFNSPITGVIFSIEIILTDVTIAALTPLLIASVCGALVSFVLLGEGVLLFFNLTDTFSASDVPFYLLLGILCGLTSLYFTRTMFKVEGFLEQTKNTYTKAILGGLGLSLIIFVLPPVYGEGYEAITNLLSGNGNQLINDNLLINQNTHTIFFYLFLLALILVKPIATAITIGAGGSGGIFAPSLFIGAITGYLYAQIVNSVALNKLISPSNFTLVGMCGIMSGVLHAPLTSIFLIAEITSGYTLFVPLMIVSAISYITITYFEKHSFYTKRLVEKGNYFQSDRDSRVLSLIHLKKIIETDLLEVSPSATLDDMVELIRHSKRNIFPVVSDEQELKGIVTLDDVREVMFDVQKRKSTLIKSIMHDPPESVSTMETMPSVMSKFERTGAWNLPVIDDGKYIGFVSKSRIFNAYRKQLIKQSQS